MKRNFYFKCLSISVKGDKMKIIVFENLIYLCKRQRSHHFLKISK